MFLNPKLPLYYLKVHLSVYQRESTELNWNSQRHYCCVKYTVGRKQYESPPQNESLPKSLVVWGWLVLVVAAVTFTLASPLSPSLPTSFVFLSPLLLSIHFLLFIIYCLL